jgi:hypothetical protein
MIVFQFSAGSSRFFSAKNDQNQTNQLHQGKKNNGVAENVPQQRKTARPDN